MRFDDPAKRFEEKINLQIIFFSEIINAKKIELDVVDLENLISEKKSALIILLADTEFDIIEGTLYNPIN
jgi:DNA-binding winged helix-turn-helix (wHTH) protein